ncbi:MAG: PAS domain-containing protein, partial [Desulfosarcinaceae bacterium]
MTKRNQDTPPSEEVDRLKACIQDLEKREEQFRMLFETMSQGVVYQNGDGTIISANPAAGKILGLSMDQIMGRTSLDPRWRAIHEDGSAFTGETHPSMLALKTGQEVRDVIMGIFNPETEDYRWIEITAVPQYIPGQAKPWLVYTTFDDITERKRVEEVLRQERNKAQKYLDVAGVMMIALDARGMVTLVNQKGSEILGYPRAEVVGKNWFDHFVPERIRDTVRDVFVKLMAGEIEPVEYFENPVLTRSGEEKILAWHNTVLKDEDGRSSGTLSSGEDITERRQAENDLRLSSKKLRMALEASSMGTWDWDIQAGRVEWSPETLQIVGVGPAAFGESYEAYLAFGPAGEREA